MATKRSASPEPIPVPEKKSKTAAIVGAAAAAVAAGTQPELPILTPPKSAASAPPAAVPSSPGPASRSQEIIRNPYVLYPPYDTFNPALILFAKDPQPSKEGSGQILFLMYMYEVAQSDGQKRVVTKPLLIQTPNGMHSPVGVTVWPDGKASTLLSCGRDWEANALMVAFKQVLDQIQERCCNIVVDKQWNSPQSNEISAVRELFTPLVFVSESEKGEVRPPSLKASVILTGASRTEFFEFADKPPMREMVAGDVAGGSSMTMILHIAWVYRKKNKKVWQFSIRATAFQAVVELPGSANLSRKGCSVMV